jgi:predicted 3-demethylubiquinone-9 3-methyltransferase (glyoxalase superfamily)
MASLRPITPCLWFDSQAEEAAALYTAIFPNSRVTKVLRYNDAGKDVHGMDAGKVLTVSFELDGQPYTALNGGPHFKFSEAVSFQVLCETQAEVDHYWHKLSEGGDPAAQQCGWLKDRFGLSWQVTPAVLIEMLGDPDTAKAKRAMESMLRMKTFDIAELTRAFEGR